MKIIYKLKRGIKNPSKETIFLNINGQVIDFINLKENEKNLNKVKTFIYNFDENKKNKNEINLSVIYKRKNLTISDDENSNENLIEIKEISISNTLKGGNYKCVPCKNVHFLSLYF